MTNVQRSLSWPLALEIEFGEGTSSPGCQELKAQIARHTGLGLDPFQTEQSGVWLHLPRRPPPPYTHTPQLQKLQADFVPMTETTSLLNSYKASQVYDITRKQRRKKRTKCTFVTMLDLILSCTPETKEEKKAFKRQRNRFNAGRK